MNEPIPEDEYPEYPEDEFFFYPECRPAPPFSARDALRSLPWNKGLEQAVLSAMLQYSDSAIGEVVLRGGGALFYGHGNRLIAATLIEMWEGSSLIDVVSLSHELDARGRIDSIGGPAQVANLISEIPGADHLSGWLDKLCEYLARRKLVLACTDTLAAIEDGVMPLPDLLDQAESSVLRVRDVFHTGEIRDIRPVLYRVIQDLEDRFTDGVMGGRQGLATGLKGLDRLTNGLHGGELTVVAGAPGVGKTTLACNLVESVGLGDRGHPVAWITLQETGDRAMERLVIARSGLNLHEVRSGQLRQKDLDKIRSAASEVAESPILIEDGESHLAPLAHKFRRWRQRNDLRMIVVDTLQDLRSDSARAVYSFERELAEIAGFLKAIAVELNVPVLAFASLSGPPTDLRDGPPSLARIGSLWPILDHADVVANLCETVPHEDGFVPDHSHELHVLKQRYGPREKVDLHFDFRGLRFRDADWCDVLDSGPGCEGGSVVVSENDVFDS